MLRGMKTLSHFFKRIVLAKRSTTATGFGWFWLSYGGFAVWADQDSTYFAIGILGGLVWFAAADILRELESQGRWREHNDTIITAVINDFAQYGKDTIAQVAEEPSVHA